MYYGQYKGTCGKEILSTPRDQLDFPSGIRFDCTTCNINHSFRLISTLVAGTESLKKQLKEFCITKRIEQDVEIPIK